MLEDRSLLAAFTPGNLVVERVGALPPDNAPLTNIGSPVFLDEYTPAGAFVQSIAMPTVQDGVQRPLVANGVKADEGMLTLSADGRYLFLTGYHRSLPPSGASLPTTPATTVNRTIARVDWLGNVDTIMGLNNVEKGIYTVASLDGSQIWVSGENGTVQRAAYGAPSASIIVAPSATPGRQLHIFDNQLYLSTSTRIAAVGSGLPNALTTLSGPSELNLADSYGFFFADLSAQVGGLDTLYVASDGVRALSKYSLYDGVWTLTGTVGTSTDKFRGLTASVTGNSVTLYATASGGTGASGGGRLIKLVDTSGYNGELASIPEVLSVATSQTAFRGVAFVPHADNNAPTYNTAGSPSLASVTQVAVNNQGSTVADLIASAGGDPITDLDAGALEGIAVVAANDSAGEWQYSLNGGENWSPLGTVAHSSARLLAADGATRIRLVPNGTFTGAISDALHFRAWDQTSGINGGLLDTTGRVGADGAFSAFTETASIEVLVYTNAAPTISAIIDQVLDEDANRNISFAVGDDNDLSALTITAVSDNPALFPATSLSLSGSGPNHAIVIAPAPHRHGSATITITVTDADGASASEIFAVTVASVNDLPTLSAFQPLTLLEDSPARDIAFTISDQETPLDELVIAVTSDNPTLLPAPGLTVSGTGPDRVLRIVPASNQFGTATVTVKITDTNGGTSLQTFALSVTAVNDLPLLSPISDTSTPEDTPLADIDLVIEDVETPAAEITIVVTSDNPILLPEQQIEVVGSGGNRRLRISPAPNRFGSATVTLTVMDSDGGSSSQTFIATVSPVNDPPTISGLEAISLPANAGTGPLSFTLSDNDHDPGSLSVVAESSNLELAPLERIVIEGNGSERTVTVYPVKNRAGNALITLRVSDSNNAQATTTFELTVAANQAPTLAPLSDQSLIEDGSLEGLPLTINDAETVSSELIINLTSDNLVLFPAGSLLVSGQGAERTMKIAPAADQSGSALITATVIDENGATATQTFSVRVDAINDPPLAIDTTLAVTQDAAEHDSLRSADVDGPDLTYSLASIPRKGVVTITDPSTGAFTYRPHRGEYGPDRFTFQVSDGIAGPSTATVWVNVIQAEGRAVLESGVLTVTGTPYDDYIVIAPRGDSDVVAVVGHQVLGPFPRPDSIHLVGGGGRDYLLVHQLEIPADFDYGDEPSSSSFTLESPVASESHLDHFILPDPDAFISSSHPWRATAIQPAASPPANHNSALLQFLLDDIPLNAALAQIHSSSIQTAPEDASDVSEDALADFSLLGSPPG